MQRISPGSLIEFKAAKNNLEQMGFNVLSHLYYNNRTLCEEVHVLVRTPELNALIDRYYDCGRDVDVVYNSAAEWMRRVAKQLEYWK